MLIWNIFLLLLGFCLLLKSSRWVIRYLISISSFLKISEFVTSFILMSFATTLPELIVGLNSAISGAPQLSVGNSFGSNLINVGFILGLVAIITGRVTLGNYVKQYDAWPIFFLGIAPIALLLDGFLSRSEGIILLILFISYFILLLVRQSTALRSEMKSWRNHYNNNHSPAISRLKIFLTDLSRFTLSVLLLLLSAHLVVTSSQSLASFLNLPYLIVGLFLIAFGTSLPELFFALRASFSKHSELSLGNLIGASAFNSTCILGLVAVINPITITSADLPAFYITSIAMFSVLLLANIFLKTKGFISRSEGFSLLLIYLLFITSNFFFYG